MNAPVAHPLPIHPRGGRILPDLTRQASPAPADLAVAGRPRGRVPFSVERIRELVEAGVADVDIAAELGCSLQLVRLRRRAMGLLKRRKVSRLPAAQAFVAPARLSRKLPHAADDRVARMPPVNHPALSEARTIYPTSVVPVAGLLNVLVSGTNAWKIGARIVKGRWRGFPVFTLTLQERATCPTSCAHWRSCYGNAMNWAKRVEHGAAFEERLALEVGVLASRYPAGFAVRLHVLGDFYSVGYVDLWRMFVERYPNLHVFGFSARIDLDDPIAITLATVIIDHWPRFAIRLSNAPYRVGTTVSIEHPLQKPADAIVCPQQTGRTASCATCALCWSTDQRIAFLRH